MQKHVSRTAEAAGEEIGNEIPHLIQVYIEYVPSMSILGIPLQKQENHVFKFEISIWYWTVRDEADLQDFYFHCIIGETCKT